MPVPQKLNLIVGWALLARPRSRSNECH